MVKQKQSHVRSAPDKKPNQGLLNANPNPLGEGDWTMVKKQRITILIPPLPVKVQPAIPNVEECDLQEKPTKTNSEPSKQSLHETENSISLSPETTIHAPKIVHPSESNSTSQKPSSLLHRIASDNYPHGKGIGGRKGMMVFADGSTFLNQRMRASYLEKKLKRAGGLENWLVSLGLTCFVNVFRRKGVNKFQLANLTMKKLKDMGVDAVGPRRKLMHAIDCLCEPHCFQQHGSSGPMTEQGNKENGPDNIRPKRNTKTPSWMKGFSPN